MRCQPPYTSSATGGNLTDKADSDNSLVRWYAGTLVRWYAGTLVRWFASAICSRLLLLPSGVYSLSSVTVYRVLSDCYKICLTDSLALHCWLSEASSVRRTVVRQTHHFQGFVLACLTKGGSALQTQTEPQSCSAEHQLESHCPPGAGH